MNKTTRATTHAKTRGAVLLTVFVEKTLPHFITSTLHWNEKSPSVGRQAATVALASAGYAAPPAGGKCSLSLAPACVTNLHSEELLHVV